MALIPSGIKPPSYTAHPQDELHSSGRPSFSKRIDANIHTHDAKSLRGRVSQNPPQRQRG